MNMQLRHSNSQIALRQKPLLAFSKGIGNVQKSDERMNENQAAADAQYTSLHFTMDDNENSPVAGGISFFNEKTFSSHQRLLEKSKSQAFLNSLQESRSAFGMQGSSQGMASSGDQKMGLSSIRGKFTGGRGISSGWSSSGSEGYGRSSLNQVMKAGNSPMNELGGVQRRFGSTVSQSAAA